MGEINDVPEVSLFNHTTIKIIAGEVAGVKGPIQDIVTEPAYLDVTVPESCEFRYPTQPGAYGLLPISSMAGDIFAKKK